MAEKIGQVFRNSTKKNQLFISDGSRVINLLMKPCNLAFLQKKDDSKFNVESKCEVKMRSFHLKK
jgi:hypothetical protein